MKLRTDLNPILDEGAPTSTGGIEEATAIYDQLGIRLVLDPPRNLYVHSWGATSQDPRSVVCTCNLVVNDRDDLPAVLPFDLVRGSSPFLLGLDEKRYSDNMNRTWPSVI